MMGTIVKSSSVRVLEVWMKDRVEFHRRYLNEPTHGGVMVSVREPIEVSEVVELVVSFTDTGQVHRLRGLVLWCRNGEGEVRHLGVGFFASEAEKRERLLSRYMAPGKGVPERREPRYTTTLKVTYQTPTDFVVDYTRNLSTGGIFVDGRNAPDVGSEILLKLYPPGHEDPIDLTGRVAWKRPSGGFGVRFTNTSSSIRGRLDRLVRTVAIGAPVDAGAPVFEEVTPA
jgi:uncharacterized protein (TIGR02266 family)